jgi:hypothetical protein
MLCSDAPCWSPLERAVGRHRLDDFLWMFELRLDDGRTAHAYKHRTTRRYLYLTTDDETLGWWGEDRYRPIDRAVALQAVLGAYDP